MRSVGTKKLSNLRHVITQGDFFSKWDWILLGVLTLFCFISFCHEDIIVTGNRAWKVYESHFFDYCDVLYRFTNNYGANYMPTTFMMFALWILPLKLLGFEPPAYRESRLLYVMWYKLLPTLIYFGSAYLIYLIAKQIGMNQRRAKVCMYSFMTMPIAFFSQFMFSQYDIFTVFFMLLGIFFFLRSEKNTCSSCRDHILFCLSFGLAITCKYYALLIFLVWLLIHEKKVRKLIISVLICTIPFIVEYLLFAHSGNFQKSVFGFSALGFISGKNFTTDLGSFSFTKVSCLIMIIWAYFVVPKDYEDKIRWALYLSCGVCFSIFAFMSWHPQWLLFAVPFWVLSAFINKHTEKFYWCNTVFAIIFYLLIFQVWESTLDTGLLRNGLWKYVYEDSVFLKHAVDMVPKIDRNTEYSVVFAMLLALFVFYHPQYTRENFSEDDGHDNMWLVRLQLIVAVAVFAIPTFGAANDAIKNEYIYIGGGETQEFTLILKNDRIDQEIGGIEGELTEISAYFGTYARQNTADLYVEIIEKETGYIISTCEVNTQKIVDGTYHDIDIPDIWLQKNKVYIIRLKSHNGEITNGYAIGKSSNNDDYVALWNDIRTDKDYQMILRLTK